MSIWSRFDWKYFFMFLVGLSALYPAWLPLFQPPESELDVRLISQSALQPSATQENDFGLKIFIDGTSVIDPYLSVIQLVNTGNKPIASRDFESSIVIAIGESKQIIRAQVTDVSPKGLKPTMTFDNNQTQLQPMLLNPHDTITLAILSTGGKPTFHPFARIAGIEALKLSFLDKEKQNPYFTPTLIIVILLFTIASNAMAWRFEITKKVITISRWTSLLANVILLNLALFAIALLIPRLGLESSWLLLPIYLAASIITLPLVIWLERRPSQLTTDKEAQAV